MFSRQQFLTRHNVPAKHTVCVLQTDRQAGTFEHKDVQHLAKSVPGCPGTPGTSPAGPCPRHHAGSSTARPLRRRENAACPQITLLRGKLEIFKRKREEIGGETTSFAV